MKLTDRRLWQSGIAILEDNIFEKKILPEGSAIAEKRKDARVSVNVPLQYRMKNKSTPWESVDSVDVSNSGVRLSLAHKVAVGSHIELDVHLPGAKKSILLNGIIMWVRPSPASGSLIECGVAFENLKRVTKKEKLISFLADQLCGIAIKQSPGNLWARPAETFEELKSAYKLIYKEYAARGYCKEHPSEMHYSTYAILPESRTFLLGRDNHFLGTVSLIVDSPCGLPMELLFSDLIKQLRGGNRKLAEVGLLALDQEAFHKRSFSLTDFQKLTGSFRLFKLMLDYARTQAHVTDLLIAVHPKHEDLYRYLNFEIMGPPLPYYSACGKPALPMHLDLEATRKGSSLAKNLRGYFFDQKTPENILKQHFEWDEASLRYLLVEIHALWEELPDVHRKYIQSCYPQFKPVL